MMLNVVVKLYFGLFCEKITNVSCGMKSWVILLFKVLARFKRFRFKTVKLRIPFSILCDAGSVDD